MFLTEVIWKSVTHTIHIWPVYADSGPVVAIDIDEIEGKLDGHSVSKTVHMDELLQSADALEQLLDWAVKHFQCDLCPSRAVHTLLRREILSIMKEYQWRLTVQQYSAKTNGPLGLFPKAEQPKLPSPAGQTSPEPSTSSTSKPDPLPSSSQSSPVPSLGTITPSEPAALCAG